MIDCQAVQLNQYWCHAHELITKEDILNYSFHLLSEENIVLGFAQLGFMVAAYSELGDGESGTVERPVKMDGQEGGLLVIQVTVKKVEDMPDGLSESQDFTVSGVPVVLKDVVPNVPVVPCAGDVNGVPDKLTPACYNMEDGFVEMNLVGQGTREFGVNEVCQPMLPEAVVPKVPVEPAVPVEPEARVSSVPVEPAAPVEPEAVVPKVLVEPAVPVQPEAVVPKVPVEPAVPVDPQAWVPKVPVEPAVPVDPQAWVPKVPVEPAVPVEPEARVSSVPVEPAEPAVPVVPEAADPVVLPKLPPEDVNPNVSVVAVCGDRVKFADLERIFLTVAAAEEMTLLRAQRQMAVGDPNQSLRWMKAPLGCLGASPFSSSQPCHLHTLQAGYSAIRADWDAVGLVTAPLDPKIVAQARRQLPRLQKAIQHLLTSHQVELVRALSIIMRYLEHTADSKLVHATAIVRGLQLGGILCQAVGMYQKWVTTEEQDENVLYSLNEAPSAVLKLVEGYLELHGLRDSGGQSLSLRDVDGSVGGT